MLSGHLQVATVQLVLVIRWGAAHSEPGGHDQILQQETDRRMTGRWVGRHRGSQSYSHPLTDGSVKLLRQHPQQDNVDG